MMEDAEKMRHIAVIGGGISGIAAAHYLAPGREVVLFEKEDRLGGHTHTVTVPAGEPDAGLPVDMGFIVMNDTTYPRLNRFLDELDISRADTEMSFAFHDAATGMGYAGTTLNGLFASRSHLFQPGFWRFLWSVLRFGKGVQQDLERGRLTGITLGNYLQRNRIDDRLVRDYLLPMVGAVWSASKDGVTSFPMQSFAAFFANHGLLTFRNRPRWKYITGGSESYVRALAKGFSGTVRTSTPILRVVRHDDGVDVYWSGGSQRFDAVIFATHADLSLALLDPPDSLERELLTPWAYADNLTVLHTDTSVMPPKRRGWGAWTHVRQAGGDGTAPACIHYHMNRLQRLDARRDYIVSLNPDRSIKPDMVIESVVFKHPRFTLASLASGKRLSELNGRNRSWFCGAYQYNGFHEDGIRSALRVVRDFGERP